MAGCCRVAAGVAGAAAAAVLHEEMAGYAVSMLVDNLSNDDPRCVAPLPAA